MGIAPIPTFQSAVAKRNSCNSSLYRTNSSSNYCQSGEFSFATKGGNFVVQNGRPDRVVERPPDRAVLLSLSLGTITFVSYDQVRNDH